MASLPNRPVHEISLREFNPATVYALLVAVPTIFVIAIGVGRNPDWFTWRVPFWIALVAVAELLPVPAWRGIHVSLGFPLLMAVGILSPPRTARPAPLSWPAPPAARP